MSRSVRDEQYRYIKNYMPYRTYGQRVEYLWRAPSMPSWENAYLAGDCDEIQGIFWNTKPSEELYDTENDPWEVNNLAADPEYQDVLKRMRRANTEWMLDTKDAGFIPEADMTRRAGELTRYDYMRSGDVPLKKLIDAAEIASEVDLKNQDILLKYLKDEDSGIRYWGATGLLILGDGAVASKDALIKALSDESPNVVVVAAEALYKMGVKKQAVEALIKILEIPEDKAQFHALNAIKYTDEDGPEMKAAIVKMIPDNQYQYSSRIVEWFAEKWNLKSEIIP